MIYDGGKELVAAVTFMDKCVCSSSNVGGYESYIAYILLVLDPSKGILGAHVQKSCLASNAI
jgi:hypothetical protein